jgi:uncharacterized protein
MTRINVAGLLAEPAGAERRVTLRDHYVAVPDIELAGPLDADLRLKRTNRGIIVRGPLDAPLRRICPRCLEPFVDDVSVTVDEEFLPSVDRVTGRPLVIAEADEAVQRVDEHHEIDLTSTFHDELLLVEPMVPLHSPDCPGLCVTCGERLDRGIHDHEEPEIDPRLAGLARLLETPRD